MDKVRHMILSSLKTEIESVTETETETISNDTARRG